MAAAATGSTSTIFAGAMSYVLKIVEYSRTKAVPNGCSMKYPAFTAAGHTWHVGYFPNGVIGAEEETDYVAFFLYINDNGAAEEAVKAQAIFSLLDIEGNPVSSYSFTTVVVNFSEKKYWGYKNFIKRESLENPLYLKDECFSIRIDLAVLNDCRTEETPPLTVVVPPSDMHRHYGRLLISKEAADVEFLVGKKVFDAHRLVLAARSPVFKPELYGRMKESTTKSAIAIDDMEEEVFEAMLTFIYTDSLPKMKRRDEAAMAQNLLVAADRYNLERLKLICEDKLSKNIDTGSIANILLLAEKHSCHVLKEACFEFLRSSRSLNAVMETDEFEYLIATCPGLIKELIRNPPRVRGCIPPAAATASARPTAPQPLPTRTMPASSPASASDGASSFAIVAGTVNGCHVLKIVGYSVTKAVPNGKSIKSRPFRAGGHTWHVAYYPNGQNAEKAEYMAFFLCLDDTASKGVEAKAIFSSLDMEGNPVSSHSFTTRVVNFSEERSWGYSEFMKRGSLEKNQNFHEEETPLIVVPPSDMHRQFGDLLLSKQGVDVEFQVGRKKFDAHRLVLAARSPVFRAQFYGRMRESTTKRAIKIDDMERMKLICEDKLSKHIDAVANILALAEQHSCHTLKEACLEFLRSSRSLKAVVETDGFRKNEQMKTYLAPDQEEPYLRLREGNWTWALPAAVGGDLDVGVDERVDFGMLFPIWSRPSRRMPFQFLEVEEARRPTKPSKSLAVASLLSSRRRRDTPWSPLADHHPPPRAMTASSLAAAASDGASSSSGSASASAIVAGTVNGHHVLKIVGYSFTKAVPSGKSIRSRPFRAGGHTWHVLYYPNGNRAEKADFVAFYLCLGDAEACSEAVEAKAIFSLLDMEGNPVSSYRFTTRVVNFMEHKEGWGFDFMKRESLEESEYLKDDCFKIRIDVVVITDFHTEEETPLIVVPPSDMHRQFGDLLLSKQGADVKFQVGKKKFDAHRSVLAARSPVFKTQLYGRMRESTTRGAIRIDDMEEEVFRAMLTFVYTDDLPEMKQQEEAAMAQHLLVAADRYNLERMKLICEHNLSKHIDTDSVANILVLAEQHSCHMLKEACLKFLRLSRSLKAVMETDGFGHLISSCPGAGVISREEELLKFLRTETDAEKTEKYLGGFKEINTHQQYITMAPRSICPLLFVSFALPSCAVLLINQPALSSSSIVSDTVRAHHHLKIDGYSRIKDDIHSGECVSSCPFAVGGHLWRIDFYPNGKDAGRQLTLSGVTFTCETNHVSFYLVLVDEHVPKPVKAQFEFSFKKPKPPPTRSLFGKSKPPPLASAVQSFDCHGSCGGKATEVSKLTVERQIRDDSFTIWCDIAVLNEFRAEGATAASSSSVAAAAAAASPSYVSVPPSDLHRHLGELLASGDGADVTLEAGGETFKAHRYVLAARSSVLKAELLGPLARSTAAATPTRINVIEAPVFRAMLHFIYTDHLPETARNEEEEEEEEAAAAMAQHLLEAAERFNLERLKLVCEDKLCRGIGTATVATTLALPEQHGCHGLKEA
uniref:BTB domain-containing protein n=1 Tax=Oryza meridionalis TaxID=40149 RepID=A0A0E0DJL9_9ORYZ